MTATSRAPEKRNCRRGLVLWGTLPMLVAILLLPPIWPSVAAAPGHAYDAASHTFQCFFDNFASLEALLERLRSLGWGGTPDRGF